MTKKAIIFDLDGTIVNTLDDLADCVNHTLEKHGYPTHAVDAFKNFIGSGARNMVSAALPADIRIQADIVDSFLKEYKLYYAQHFMDKSAPYEGVLEMLAAFTKLQIPMAVCSNKHQTATEAIISHIFPPNTFSYVYGEREGIPIKPDPAAPLEIAGKMGVLPEHILFVGDSKYDMLTAVHAGMISVGVSWGFGGSKELEESNAEFIISRPAELLDIFSA